MPTNPVYSSIVGMKNIHYALLTSDDSSGAVYATPKPLAPAKNVKVSTAQNSATQYADNGPVAVATQIGETTVDIGVTDIPMEILAEITGQTLNADGVIEFNQNITAPYLALGFEGTKANGKRRFVWMYKGQFQIPDDVWTTKVDKITFQEPTMAGTFIRRDFDENFKAIGDEDVTGFDGSNWFNAVYAPAGIANPSAAPTLATVSSGGSLAAATYYVVYTWVNANGETLVSPEANVVTTGSTSKVTVTLPALPVGATSANIYMSTSAGTETKQGNTTTTTYSQSSALTSGTSQPSSNTTA